MRYKESETVELKKSTAEMKEAVIAVAAILNKHKAGQLYFGIKNDGTVVGQDISEQTLRDVSRTLSEHIEPRICPRVEKVRLEGKVCIRVRFSGQDAPYLAHGRAFIRVADEDRQLSARELERMFLSRNKGAMRWEAELSDKKLSAVDAPTVRSLVKRGNIAGRIDHKFMNVKSTLKKLELMKDNRLLKATEVLFCKDNPMEVQAAVFAGTDKLTFLDINQFRGTLFSLLERSETYVKEHMDWKVEFGGLERKEIPEVPLKALREALVNSLCHRDFRIPKGNEVAIFKNRIEIYNPGDFPEGYKPEDFIKGEERSMSPNPLVAGTLFKSKDIEKWGSGLKRIANECAENGVNVEFKILKSGFLVTFYRRPSKDLSHSTVEKTVVKTVVKTREKIIALIRQNPALTRAEIAKNTGLSVRGVEWNLDELKKQGILKRIGPDKGGHWEVVK
ncbi:MAG: putative DNA binding domain-containing protein [Elusimicrobia bacterium]|nr:putative DNA binding domain-containing protein [Elusimicrobiota bacterium]